MVSGDLDGDRLDYLVRDAHCTGVSVGVDMGRIMNTMTMADFLELTTRNLGGQ